MLYRRPSPVLTSSSSCPHHLSPSSLHSHQRGVATVGLLGEGRLIAGIDKGLQGICVNERRTITVPPHLAYGSTGAGKWK